MRSMSCFCKKRETTSGPKVKETPRSFSLQPVMSLSGSDQSRSQSRPQSGIYRVVSRVHIERIWKSKTYVGRAHDASDLLHGVEIGAQATVHGEDLLINDGGNGQAVEAVGKCLPQLDVVASLALIVEAVDAVDGGTLVVAAENEEVLGVLDLVGQEKADGLEGLLATVDVVTEEKVVCLGRESTVLEETEKVVVLAVNVTADLESRSVSRQIWVCLCIFYLDGRLELKEDRL